jgi:hypothetical protein
MRIFFLELGNAVCSNQMLILFDIYGYSMDIEI